MYAEEEFRILYITIGHANQSYIYTLANKDANKSVQFTSVLYKKYKSSMAQIQI